MSMVAAKHAAGEARCGHAFNTVTTSTEARLAHHQQAQSREGLGRPIITLPPPPSQPALPHGKAAEQQPWPTPLPLALSGVPAQDLQLPPLPGGQSAASSPATPPAVEEVPLSATASPPSVSHTHAAAAAPAPNPPALQQRPAATATTAPAAAASAAVAALSSTKRRLEGSLLLSQLLPLSASLSVALAAGDVSRMHAVLALLQSVPMTGQLLWASQIAKPVRGVLQQQAQLRAALQQAHLGQQAQQQAQQQQQSGMLEDVLSTAGALLRRWKALLAAEMAACDEYRTLRAHQLLRARKQKLQRAKSGGGAAAAAAAAAEHTTAQQCDSEQRGTATPRRKRANSEFQQQQQQQQQQQGQQVAPPDEAACPPRPPHPHKQRYFRALPPSEQQQAQAQMVQVQRGGSTVACQPGTSAGSSLGRVSSGPGLPGLLAPSSSNFSLAGAPGGSAVDLSELAGMEWEDTPLPEFGAAAAAAADAAIAGCVSAGIGGLEGSWGVGEEEGELLVDRPAPLQGQGQDAAAYVL